MRVLGTELRVLGGEATRPHRGVRTVVEATADPTMTKHRPDQDLRTDQDLSQVPQAVPAGSATLPLPERVDEWMRAFTDRTGPAGHLITTHRTDLILNFGSYLTFRLPRSSFVDPFLRR